MQFVARVASRGTNSGRWCAPTIGGNATGRSIAGSQRQIGSAVNEPASSVVVKTGNKIRPISPAIPNDEDDNCALLVWQLRSHVCRWPL